MSGDPAYQAGGRIRPTDPRRSRVAATAVGLAAIAVVALAVAWPAPDGRPGPARTAPPTVVATMPPATPLPTRLVGDPAGLPPTLPISAGRLRWLDTATAGYPQVDTDAPSAGYFIDRSGNVVCVCVESPWTDGPAIARVTLRRIAPDGREIDRTVLREFAAATSDVFGPSISVEAAIDPAGRFAWYARVVRAESEWRVGVDRIDLATRGLDASVDLSPIPIPADDEDRTMGPTEAGWVTRAKTFVRPSLRVSVDGDRVALTLVAFTDPGDDPAIPSYQVARYALDGLPGEPVDLVVPAHDADDEGCDDELAGWAATGAYVTVCPIGTEPTARAVPRAVARVTRPDGSVVVHDLDIAAASVSWLLDGRRGRLYGWSPIAHRLVALDVMSGERWVVSLGPDGFGERTRVPAPRVGPFLPRWASVVGAGAFGSVPRLVGSADGRLLYGLGVDRPATADPGLAGDGGSTGIWVFEIAEELHLSGLVGRWLPEARYDQIAFAPGGTDLLTLGLPGLDAAGRPAEWGSSLRVHDPLDGTVSALFGDVRDSSGFQPTLIGPSIWADFAGFPG